MILVAATIFGFLGITFLIGCFARVDSRLFIERANGNQATIARLHSLQDAWTRLGKHRQFFASSCCHLVISIGLISYLYLDPHFSNWILMPALYSISLAGLLSASRRAKAVLDPRLIGHAQALQVIRLNLFLCLASGVAFAFAR